MCVASRLFLVLECLKAFVKIVQIKQCWISLYKYFAGSQSWAGLLCSCHLTVVLCFNLPRQFSLKEHNPWWILRAGYIFLPCNGNKLYNFFVIQFIEMQYFPFVRWRNFLIKSLGLFSFFSQNGIPIKIKGLTLETKNGEIIYEFSVSIVDWKFWIILSIKKRSQQKEMISTKGQVLNKIWSLQQRGNRPEQFASLGRTLRERLGEQNPWDKPYV